MHISGRCMCGAVHFEARPEPGIQPQCYKCYCTDCRKSSGTGHAAMLGLPRSAVSISGTATEFRSTADSGRWVVRAFCAACGCSVYSRNEIMPSMIFLRASALDDLNIFATQVAVFTSRAPAWDPASPDVMSFAEMPPSRPQGAGA